MASLSVMEEFNMLSSTVSRASGKMRVEKLIIGVLFALLCMACSDKDDPEQVVKDQIEVPISLKSPVFTSEGGDDTFEFTTNTDWSISVTNTRANNWCTVSPLNGKAGTVKLSIVTEPNENYDERSATIVIVAGTATQNILITQKQKEALLITSSRIELPKEGGDVDIEIKANVSFTFQIEDGADWLTEDKLRGLEINHLKFQAKANETGYAREAKITISSDAMSESVTVYQEGDEYVDMGFKGENGKPLYWATGNLILKSDGTGYIASSPEYYVANIYSNSPKEWDLFGWADPTGMKNIYPWEDKADGTSWTWDECFALYGGENPPAYISNTSMDIAHAKLGGSWRLPTFVEFEQLIKNTEAKPYTLNGVAGYKFTSTINGNSLFFPAVGENEYVGVPDGKVTLYTGERAFYWSGRHHDETDVQEGEYYNNHYSFALYFQTDGFSCVADYLSFRYHCYSVRPVKGEL